MKKIISLILCVMLVVGLFAVLPASVSAEDWGCLSFTIDANSIETYTGEVTGVSFMYVDPHGREYPGKPSYTYKWLDEKGNVIADNKNLNCWFPEEFIAKRITLKVEVDADTCVYSTGGNYKSRINLKAVRHDYKYASGIKTDRKGKEKWKSIGWVYNEKTKKVLMSYTFEPAEFAVTSRSLSVKEPVIGGNPDLTGKAGSTIKIESIEWHDDTEDVTLGANAVFKEDHTYTAIAEITHAGGYYFPYDMTTFGFNGSTEEITRTYNEYDDYIGTFKVSHTFPPVGFEEYDLWLGDTRVNNKNFGDILGDGKAKFDPATNTLTLNKATISGSHTGADGNAASIYAEGMDLTVKGSGTIGNDNVGIGICQYNSDLTTNCSLTLDGNFTFKGEYGVFTVGSLTVDGGTITSTGTIMALGDVQVNAGLNKLEVNVSGEYGTFGSFAGQLTLDPSLRITLPAGGKVKDNGIVDANGQFVTHVVIRGESETYIRGDVDGDGEVTILDATAIQRHLASLPTKAYHEEPADADEDKEVTILDATAIQRHLASLPTQAQGIGKPIA